MGKYGKFHIFFHILSKVRHLCNKIWHLFVILMNSIGFVIENSSCNWSIITHQNSNTNAVVVFIVSTLSMKMKMCIQDAHKHPRCTLFLLGIYGKSENRMHQIITIPSAYGFQNFDTMFPSSVVLFLRFIEIISKSGRNRNN